MPVNLEGVKGTLKALRKIDPELLKEMNKEIKGVMIPIRDKARGYAPSPVPGNLYNWNEGTKGRKITARNSAFRTLNTEGRLRMFPLYDAAAASKGVYYTAAPSRRNKNGWSSQYIIANASASEQSMKPLAAKIRVETQRADPITRALVPILLAVWALFMVKAKAAAA